MMNDGATHTLPDTSKGTLREPASSSQVGSPPESAEASLALPRAAGAHRLVMIPGALGSRGLRYHLMLGDQVIVQNSLQPLLDGCRTLKALGLTGPVELWSVGGTYPRMLSTVQSGAKLSVTEGERSGPRFVAWKPFTEVERD